jgi:putative tricarboxylic transport membrane protein
MTDPTSPTSSSTSNSDPGGPAATLRWPELLVALLLLVISLFVISDSLRVGIGWADDGPKAGYFPFYIGLLLLGASGFTAIHTLVHWRRLTQSFVMRSELAGVLAVLWPTVIYVGGLAFTGLYVASALLIGYFMRRHGKYGWAATVGVPVAVMMVFFQVFERWFLVPLPKGPLERLLGF